MNYADLLRERAEWIRATLDPTLPDAERVSLDDDDADLLDQAADELERLKEKARKIRHTHVVSFDWTGIVSFVVGAAIILAMMNGK